MPVGEILSFTVNICETNFKKNAWHNMDGFNLHYATHMQVNSPFEYQLPICHSGQYYLLSILSND